MRFPKTGTVFEAEGDSGILKFLKKSNLDKSCWVSHWQRDATSRTLVHGLPQVPETLISPQRPSYSPTLGRYFEAGFNGAS